MRDSHPGTSALHMPPTSDGTRSVACSFDKLIPDEGQKAILIDAIKRVHKSTMLATELLNLHVRRCVRDGVDMSDVMSANWLLNAYNLVTTGKGSPKDVPELRITKDECMPTFVPPSRAGLTQLLMYECRNLAAVASTNVWKHYRARVTSYVRDQWRLFESEYEGLTKEERRARYTAQLQMAADICRNPQTEGRKAEGDVYSAWVDEHRDVLGIDAAVGEWGDKPLLYHLKARPQRFLRSMSYLSTCKQRAERKAFALFPLRRTFVPRHVHFDQKALRQVLHLGESAYTLQRAKDKRNASPADDDPPAVGQKRTRRGADDLVQEKADVFNQVVDLRAAGVRQASRFAYSFTTDGECVRLLMTSGAPTEPPTAKRSVPCMPARGIWSIDELKRVSRADAKSLHVVGIDPGKHNLLVAVDADRPRGSAVRYTAKQRNHEKRQKQFAKEVAALKTEDVLEAEQSLSDREAHSYSADLDAFKAYCGRRHAVMEACLAFYEQRIHRHHRWKTVIKEQQSEANVCNRLRAMHKSGDSRHLVLAYGSWGAVAGPHTANKGLPPCIGKGLMQKLSRYFTVAVTPEAYTSQTCCRCLGPAGPFEDVERGCGRKVRGLRRCQSEDCGLTPLNRDKMAAVNIATNFTRLYEGRDPIRKQTCADLHLEELKAICAECD